MKDDVPGASFGEKSYHRCRVVQLQSTKYRGLRTGGSKSDLIRRLVTLHFMQSAVRGRCRLNAK